MYILILITTLMSGREVDIDHTTIEVLNSKTSCVQTGENLIKEQEGVRIIQYSMFKFDYICVEKD